MRKNKIESKLYLIPIILVFVAILTVYYNNYKETKEIIESEYRAKIDLIEQSIYNETKYTGIISKLVENDISDKMEEYSNILINKYKEEPNLLEWDLNKLKVEFTNMDIYILDKKLTIVASTVDEEIGLDFKLYKDFVQLLEKRLMGNKFESDMINFSIQNSEMKKFSYMPTPDNKYLLELSVNIKEAYPEVKSLNIVYLSDELVDKYPFVEDIRVYKYNTDDKASYELDTMRNKVRKYESLKEDRDEYVKRALETDEAQEQIVTYNNNTYRLKYTPYTNYYEDSRLTWWDSYVSEIIYNDEILIQSISHQKNVLLRSIIILSILYFGFAYTIIYLVQKYRDRANKDYLTKLPNRKRFEEVIAYEISEAAKKGSKIALLFFDLDKFKEINDNYGHNFGDKVLQKVASRIDNEIRKGDMVSRIGGDEFVGVIPNLNTRADVIEIADRMSLIFERDIVIDSKKIGIKSSLGISIYPDHGETMEDLFLRADIAMYAAKQKNEKYKIYDDKDNSC